MIDSRPLTPRVAILYYLLLLLTFYMYDHSSATRTKRIEGSLFISRGISGNSYAKNSHYVQD
jgi:hypothetical protein